MKKIFNLLLFLSPLFLLSCQDIVDVNINQGIPALAVDGWVTTNEEPFSLTLSRTGPYFENKETPRIQGAQVLIRDNEGNADSLFEKKPGLYETRDNKKGKNRKYLFS